MDSGPEFSHPALVKTALTSLASVGASFQYPPINWSAILTPLMRLGFGKSHSVIHAYLKINESDFSVLFFVRGRRTASVCGAGRMPSSVFPKCISLSGLLAFTTACAQSQRKLFLSRADTDLTADTQTAPPFLLSAAPVNHSKSSTSISLVMKCDLIFTRVTNINRYNMSKLIKHSH